MVMKFLVLLCLGLVLAQIPLLPPSFSMDVEVNNMPRNSSFIWTQAYDTVSNRARLITYNETDTRIHWYFLNTMESYERDPQRRTCTKLNWRTPPFVDPNTGIMKPGADLFGQGSGATPAGTATVRYINCDVWTSTDTVNGVNYQRTWYYAVSSWRVRGLNSYRVPVRVTWNMNNAGLLSSASFEITNFYPNDPFYRYEFVVPRACYEPYPQIALPPLPDQFRTTVSITDVRFNATYSLTEYVDELNGRLRVDFHERNKTTEIYMDTKNGWQYTIDKDNMFNCKSEKIHPNSFWIDNGGHIFTTQQLFRFGDNEVYDGIDVVNGINCERWVQRYQRVRNFRGNNWILFQYTTVFYFAAVDWNIWTASAQRIPVRAHLVVRGLNATSNRFDSEQYIEFSNFHVGNMTGDDDGRVGVWHVPGHCLAEYTPIPLPALSPFFEIDVDISTHGHTYHFKEFFDYYNDRARFETRGPGERNNTYYYIDKMLKLHVTNAGCVKSTLESTDQMIQDGYLRSASSMLNFGSKYPYKYLGNAFIREIDCDRWWLNFTMPQQNMMFIVNYYFSTATWNSDRPTKHRVPVRIEVEGFTLVPGTYTPASTIPSFWTHFDYGSYHISQPSPYTFLEPASCLPHYQADAGVALGVFSLGLTGGMMLFALVGFVFTYILFALLFKFSGPRQLSVNIFPTQKDEGLEKL